jgi:hypothetical protein
MNEIRRVVSSALGVFAFAGCLQTAAQAQIAYVPSIGFVPTGATMTVTPAVSADRRYVRLGVDAFFNDLNNIQTFSFPGGAVGGGNFGGFGAGIAAGMNGVIGDDGYQAGIQVGNGFSAANVAGAARGPDMMRAGPLPAGAGGLGPQDPLFAGAAGMGQGGEMGFVPGFDDEAALMMTMVNAPRRSVRASAGSHARSSRQKARRSTSKSNRRQPSSAQRKSP